jgi:soluble lytic murein transglycosylase-like protein
MDVENVSYEGDAHQELNSAYQNAGMQYSIDWRLLKAVAMQESNENPDAFNPDESGGSSYGLLQIYCQGDTGPCRNDLYVDGWPPESRGRLFDVPFNLQIGAQILGWNLRTYGFPKGVAVYNCWGARKSPTNGPFPRFEQPCPGNDVQGYVSNVLDNYRMLKNLYPESNQFEQRGTLVSET